MPCEPAARVTDQICHGSKALLGAVIGAAVAGPFGAIVGAIIGSFIVPTTGMITGPGHPTTLIGFLPSTRVLDMVTCTMHPPSPAMPGTITEGSQTVLIGGLPAARVTSATFCGGSIKSGLDTVLIGGAVEVFPYNIDAQGNPTFVADVQRAMARVYGTNTGKVFIRGTAESGNTVTITPGGNTCTAQDGAAMMNPGEGCNSVVAWDPSLHYLNSDPPGVNAGADVVLAHELIHAYHNATGTNGNGPRDLYPNQGGTGSSRGEERQTVGTSGGVSHDPKGNPINLSDHSKDVPTENSLRDELGIPRRPTYYPHNWPGGPPW